jgi:hypothetical protein
MIAIHCRSNTPSSWLVRFFCWSPWSHLILLHPNGWDTYEAVWPRVKKSTLPEVLAVNGTCHAVDYECEDPEAAMEWCASQVGKPYDLFAVFGHVVRLVRRIQRGARAWFCTDFGAMAFEKGRSPKFRPSLVGRITPWDWWALPGRDVPLDALMARIGMRRAA